MQNSANGRTDRPLDRLKSEASELLGAVGDRTFSSIRGKVEDATDRLAEYTTGEAAPKVKAAVRAGKSLAEGKSPAKSMLSAGVTAAKEKVGKMFGKSGGSKKGPKVTNIVESIDVGLPVKLAYGEWTQFTKFPGFMKKVENVEQNEDQKLTWSAQVFWSHRKWESTILEQVPDEKIIWRSQGDKGYVDGAVTFHELAPNLTRILVTLEYHPKGFMEHTGNIWRAQGRRVRLELKNFQRHVMTESLLHTDEIEGWRGVISEGKVQDQGKGQSTRGRAAKKDDTGDKGSTRTRRAPAGNRASASSGRSSAGSGQRAGGRSSPSPAPSGSSARSSRSSTSGGTSAASRSSSSSGTSGTKSRPATSRSKKATSS